MTISKPRSDDHSEKRLHPAVVVGLILWIQVKLMLIMALINRNIADFVYAGF